jgi:hypothetical protein
MTKYTVINSSGDPVEIEAQAVEEVFEPAHRVSFFSDAAKTKPVGTFTNPPSWGPSPKN